MRTSPSAAARLEAVIRSRPRAVVAFSGGVDSTLLLRVCRDVLGRENVVAVTGVSPTYTAEELRTARRVARGLGVEHVLIETDELACAAFAANPADRCYHCKGELFDRILDLATAPRDRRRLRRDQYRRPLRLPARPPGDRGTGRDESPAPGRVGQEGRPPPLEEARPPLLGQAGQSLPGQPRPLRNAHHPGDPRQDPGRRDVHPGPGLRRRQAPPPRPAGPHRGPGRGLRPADEARDGPLDRRQAPVARLSLDRPRHRRLPHREPQPGRRRRSRQEDRDEDRRRHERRGRLLRRRAPPPPGRPRRLRGPDDDPVRPGLAGRGPERLFRPRRGRSHPLGRGGLRPAGHPLPHGRLFRSLRGVRPPLLPRRLRRRDDPEPLHPLQSAGQVRRPAGGGPRRGSRLRPPRDGPLRPRRIRRRVWPAPPQTGRRRPQGPVLLPLPPEPGTARRGPFPARRLGQEPGPGDRPGGRPPRPRPEGKPGLLRRRPGRHPRRRGERWRHRRPRRPRPRPAPRRPELHHRPAQGAGHRCALPPLRRRDRRGGEQARRRPGERDLPALDDGPRLRLGSFRRARRAGRGPGQGPLGRPARPGDGRAASRRPGPRRLRRSRLLRRPRPVGRLLRRRHCRRRRGHRLRQ